MSSSTQLGRLRVENILFSLLGHHPEEGQKSCTHEGKTRKHGTVWAVAARNSHSLRDNQCTECSCTVRYSPIFFTFTPCLLESTFFWMVIHSPVFKCHIIIKLFYIRDHIFSKCRLLPSYKLQESQDLLLVSRLTLILDYTLTQVCLFT